MGLLKSMQYAGKVLLLTGFVTAGASGIWSVSAESKLNVATTLARQNPTANIDCSRYKRRVDYAKRGAYCGIGLALGGTLVGGLSDTYQGRRREDELTFDVREE